MHESGFLHMDIKADNLLIFHADRGIQANLKLCDYGCVIAITNGQKAPPYVLKGAEEVFHNICTT